MSMIRSGQTRSGNGAWHTFADVTARNEPEEREDWPTFDPSIPWGNFPPYPTLAELARYTNPIPRPHIDGPRYTPEIIKAWEEDREWAERIEGHRRHDSQTSVVVSRTMTA